MICSYDVSTQMHSNNLSTKTANRSNASSEEIDQYLENNMNQNKGIRQSRISSNITTQSSSSNNNNNNHHHQQSSAIKQHPIQNYTHIDYYSNANNLRVSQTTKNSKNGSFSFIFDDVSSATKAQTNRNMQGIDLKHEGNKYDNEFIDMNVTQYSRQKVRSKDYTQVRSKDLTFPVIFKKDKVDDIKNQTNRSNQFYNQTSSQPLQQAISQKNSDNDFAYQSQPHISDLVDKLDKYDKLDRFDKFDKLDIVDKQQLFGDKQQQFGDKQQQQQQQSRDKAANYSKYQKRRIQFLEQNQVDSENIRQCSPLQEEVSRQKSCVEPNRNNRIRSQIYQKKRQQIDNILENDSSTQGYHADEIRLKKSYCNKEVFDIMDREAFIDSDIVNQNYNMSPQIKNNINKQVGESSSIVNRNHQQLLPSNNSQDITKKKENNHNNYHNPGYRNSDDKNKIIDDKNRIIDEKGQIITDLLKAAMNDKQFNQQQCFEEMHFFQVEFLQKCKSWMNQLEHLS